MRPLATEGADLGDELLLSRAQRRTVNGGNSGGVGVGHCEAGGDADGGGEEECRGVEERAFEERKRQVNETRCDRDKKRALDERNGAVLGDDETWEFERLREPARREQVVGIV